MSSKQIFWKSFIPSLFLMGETLFAFPLWFTEKVNAQTNPNQVIASVLSSGSGRWLEIDSRNFMCTIYDFKPSGVLAVMRIVRQGYGLNPISGQCRFSTAPFAPNFGAVGQVVNGNTLVIQFPSGVTEQIRLVRFDNSTQKLVIQRGNVLSSWQPSSR